MEKIINPLGKTYLFKNTKGEAINATIISADPLLVQTEDGKTYNAHLSIDGSGPIGKKCHHIHFHADPHDLYGFYTSDANDFPIWVIAYREDFIDDNNCVRINDKRTLYYYAEDAMKKDYQAFLNAYTCICKGNRTTNRKEMITEEELPYTDGSRQITYRSECCGSEHIITIKSYLDYPVIF